MLSFRWIVFVVGFFVTFSSGSQYAITVYSPLMKDTMRWYQSQLTLVQTLGDVGLFLGYFIGIVFDKFGPKWTSILSAALVFSGYFGLYWLFKYGTLISPSLSWIIAAVCFFVVGQGSNGSNCVALTTNMKNFPGKRKPLIVGILKAGFTFGSMAVAATYHLFFNGRLAPFMLTMAIATGGIQLVGTLGLKVVPTAVAPQNKGKNPLVSERKWLLVNASEDDLVDNRLESAENQDEEEIYEESDDDMEGEDEVLQSMFHKQAPPAAEIANPELDKFGWVLLRKRTFWLLWISYTIMQGCGLMVLNQVSSMVMSFGECDGSTSGSVSSSGTGTTHVQNVIALCTLLFNLGNAIGRVLTGLTDRWIPTTWMFIGLLGSSTLLNLYYIFADYGMFLYAPFVSGLLIGGANTLSAVLTNKFFGMPHFGQNYGLVTMAQGIGGLIFTYTAGILYDQQANCDGGLVCFGENCFRYSFVVTCAASFVGTVCATGLVSYLHIKSRKQKQSQLEAY